MSAEENWKQFQGTELGSLLASLYGNQNRVAINYPKPKSKGAFNPAQHSFLPVNSIVASGASDPRKSTRKNVAVAIPSFRGGHTAFDQENMQPISIIPRRKNEETIKAEMETLRQRQKHYRPAYVQPISSEAEKEPGRTKSLRYRCIPSGWSS